MEKRSAIDALLLFSSTINLKQSAAFPIRFSRKASAVGDTRIVTLARLGLFVYGAERRRLCVGSVYFVRLVFRFQFFLVEAESAERLKDILNKFFSSFFGGIEADAAVSQR